MLTSHDSPLAHLIPALSPTRADVNRASLTESLLNECPVCQTSLSPARLSEDEATTHIARCLERVSGPTISGNMYAVQELTEDVPAKECAICFEDFLAGNITGLLWLL